MNCQSNLWEVGSGRYPGRELADCTERWFFLAKDKILIKDFGMVEPLLFLLWTKCDIFGWVEDWGARGESPFHHARLLLEVFPGRLLHLLLPQHPHPVLNSHLSTQLALCPFCTGRSHFSKFKKFITYQIFSLLTRSHRLRICADKEQNRLKGEFALFKITSVWSLWFCLFVKFLYSLLLLAFDFCAQALLQLTHWSFSWQYWRATAQSSTKWNWKQRAQWKMQHLQPRRAIAKSRRALGMFTRSSSPSCLPVFLYRF